MKILFKLFLVFCLLLSLALVTGCGKKSTNIETKDGKVKIETESGGEKVKVKTEEGEAEFGTGTKIPDNWPSDIPIYPGSSVMGSVDISGEAGEKSINVILTTTDPVDKVKAYYSKELKANDWEIMESADFTTGEGSFGGFSVNKGGRNGTVTFGTSTENKKEATLITITIIKN